MALIERMQHGIKHPSGKKKNYGHAVGMYIWTGQCIYMHFATDVYFYSDIYIYIDLSICIYISYNLSLHV